MPYISKEKRGIARRSPTDVGELTYCLTDMALRYLDRKENIRYADLAEVTAALMQTMFAIQERIVGLYEMDKKSEHGDLPMFLQIRNRIYDRIWSRPMQSRGA